MKKIYIPFVTLIIFNVAHAQTLTLAANEPIIGNTEMKKGYDSVGVVPKATGAGINWNFGAFTQNTTTPSSAFTSTTGAPSATVYTGATLAENQGSGAYNYWKSVATPSTQFELLGSYDPSGAIVYNYTNSAIYYVWPIAFGYTNTDTYGGPVTGGATGTLNGSITVNASGSGSLVLPGGFPMYNILQVKVVNSVTVNVTAPVSQTLLVKGTDYMYYHTSQKFPLITVSYESVGGAANTCSININNAVLTGLNEKNFDATFQIFPNPAKDAFNVKLNNPNNANGIIEIVNVTGQLIRTINLGTASVLEQNISLHGLNSGIYSVKTTIGDRASTRKLVIE